MALVTRPHPAALPHGDIREVLAGIHIVTGTLEMPGAREARVPLLSILGCSTLTLYARFRQNDMRELAYGYMRNVLREAFSEVASKMPIQEIYGAGKSKMIAEVDTWDGKLPVYSGGGAIPMLNIPR